MNNTARLLRRGILLEYATLTWNVVGVGILITTAWIARSVALAGFGLDSLVEIIASLVVIWQLRGIHHQRQARALRIIALSFYLLGAYILVQSSVVLSAQTHSHQSTWGIVWLALTLAVMLALAGGKRRIGTQLNNIVLQTEARVTLVDACLAASTLLGLVLNALCGWWWTDPLAGFVIVIYSLIEGRHAWQAARLP